MVSPDAIPAQPQTQEALDHQLAKLIVWANRLGFYDAADYLIDEIRRRDREDGNPR
jgi:hypothetical protein